MIDDRFGTHVQLNYVASSLRVSATTWPATAMTTRAGLHSIAIGPSGPGSLACFSFMFRSPPPSGIAWHAQQTALGIGTAHPAYCRGPASPALPAASPASSTP